MKEYLFLIEANGDRFNICIERPVDMSATEMHESIKLVMYENYSTTNFIIIGVFKL